MNIPVSKSQSLKLKPSASQLGFGQHFSDHLFIAEYDGQKWTEARIVPYQNFSLDPGAAVLHYGQALFEGMKAFRQTTNNNRVVLFRPEYNWQRMTQGAARLCMQAPPKELMLEGIKELVKIDQSWIPAEKGCSLYIRPTLIGTEAFLGVRPSNKFLFYIMLSPVGLYYKEGLSPVPIWVEEKYVRAAPGGLGFTKAGANYAASLLAAQEAKKKGYAQVLWLDVSHQYIEEVGTMNVFFVIDDEVITPSLDGTILSGGVRDCTIQMLKAWGIKISERKLKMSEVMSAFETGRLKEAFGTGTAAVITPVGELNYQNRSCLLNEGKIGPIAQRLYSEITAIQYGEKVDTWGWTSPLEF